MVDCSAFDPLQGRDGVSDIEDKLVIPSFVRADEGRSDPEAGGLAGTLEMEDRAAPFEWIRNGDRGAVPALALVVGSIRIAGIRMIEAVGQAYWLPQVGLFFAPDLPDAVKLTLPILPTSVETLGSHNGIAVARRPMRVTARSDGASRAAPPADMACSKNCRRLPSNIATLLPMALEQISLQSYAQTHSAKQPGGGK